MKRLQRLTKKSIREQFAGRHDFRLIRKALPDFQEWYLAEIDVDDFQRLIMVSSPSQSIVPRTANLPLMSQTLAEIEADPDFFGREDRLNGQHIHRLLTALQAGQPLKECFIIDRTKGMPTKGS